MAGNRIDKFGVNFVIDNGIIDPCVIDGKRYMGHETGWVTLSPHLTVNELQWLPSISSSTTLPYSTPEEEEALEDIDEILDGITQKVDAIEERLSKLECRLGDSLGRIEQSLDQIVRQVYKTY